MTQFTEIRWRIAALWLLGAFLGFMVMVLPVVIAHGLLLFATLAWVLYSVIMFLKSLFFPSTAVTLDPAALNLTILGYLPKVWLQRRKTVTIPFADVVSIRIGKLTGGDVPDPSHVGHLHQWIDVTYQNDGRQEQIHYPHYHNIKNWPELLTQLRDQFGARITGIPDPLVKPPLSRAVWIVVCRLWLPPLATVLTFFAYAFSDMENPRVDLHFNFVYSIIGFAHLQVLPIFKGQMYLISRIWWTTLVFCTCAFVDFTIHILFLRN